MIKRRVVIVMGLALIMSLILQGSVVSAYTLSQSTGSNGSKVYITTPRTGEHFYSWPASQITSISFDLSKIGASMTGTLYCTVRQSSNDALLGVLGQIEVGPIAVDGYHSYTFNTTPVINPIAQDLRIQVEFSGGDAWKYMLIRYTSSNVYGGGCMCRHTTDLGAEVKWTNLTWFDGPVSGVTVDVVAKANVKTTDGVTWVIVKSIDGIE
jgi:hypothetical protein